MARKCSSHELVVHIYLISFTVSPSLYTVPDDDQTLLDWFDHYDKNGNGLIDLNHSEETEYVEDPTHSTSIHGALVTLSPVKKGWKSTFFDGMLADETSQIRLVGFKGMQQRKSNEYHRKDIAVQLEDCEVKAARQGKGYKVMLKSYTKIS